MDVVSLAWRTDLALLAARGSEVEHHPTFVVVRTPDAPQRRWGNFLLLRRRPLTRDLPLVRAAFAHHLPEARHEAFGLDDPTGDPADLAPFRGAGFTTSSAVVLAAGPDTPLPRPAAATALHLRPLLDDADWEQRVRLSVGSSLRPDPVHLEYLRARAAEERAMVDLGGAWFGAFDEECLLGVLGVVPAAPGLARLHGVEVPRRLRGRTLEQALLHAAAAHVRAGDGSATLVAVADPHHPSVELWRSLGFADAGRRLQAERDGLGAQRPSQARNAAES